MDDAAICVCAQAPGLDDRVSECSRNEDQNVVYRSKAVWRCVPVHLRRGLPEPPSGGSWTRGYLDPGKAPWWPSEEDQAGCEGCPA